jgi:hypothetical protein
LRRAARERSFGDGGFLTNTTEAEPTQVFLIDAPFPYDQVARVDVYIVRVAAGTSADTTDTGPGVIATPQRT